MKMRYLFLASALCAVGCAKSNDRPAEDPSMVGGVNTATASSESTINPATSYAAGPGATSAETTKTVTTTVPTQGSSTGTISDATPSAPVYADSTHATNGAGTTSGTARTAAPGAHAKEAPSGGRAPAVVHAPVPIDTTAHSEPRAADGTVAATNTKLNERDRNPSNLTPMDQGNSKDELRITQAIRKGVMADKGLSVNAKNIKIITVGTRVTLRGPVANDQEKASIASRAKQTPGVTDVDDQLEIKK